MTEPIRSLDGPAEPYAHVRTLARAAFRGNGVAKRELTSQLGGLVEQVVTGVLGNEYVGLQSLVRAAIEEIIGGMATARRPCDPVWLSFRVALRAALDERGRALARPVTMPRWSREWRAFLDGLQTLSPREAEIFAARVLSTWTMDRLASAQGREPSQLRRELQRAKASIARREARPLAFESVPLHPEPLIDRLLDGTLDARGKRQLAEHAQRCPACRLEAAARRLAAPADAAPASGRALPRARLAPPGGRARRAPLALILAVVGFLGGYLAYAGLVAG